MSEQLHPNVVRVVEAAAERGLAIEPRSFPDGTKTAADAAAAIGVQLGFPIGGVPPFGHLTHLDVFIDPDLLQYDEVWAAAGTWTHVFGIEPHKLLEASEGLVTDLKRS